MFKYFSVGFVCLFTGLPCRALAGPEPAAPAKTAIILSVPVVVTGLPARADYVVVTTPVDFGAILGSRKVTGLVDERTIRLFRVDAGDRETQEPVQYSPAVQPRATGAKLLPNTRPAVSYRGEIPAGEKGPSQAGTLTWASLDSKQGTAQYRLEFAVPRDGRAVQVPFPPQNFRHFDPEGRPSPVEQFPVMQLHPQWPFDGVVRMNRGTELLTTYHIGPTTAPSSAGEVRRPFFYPVIGPDGIPLTEFGKPHDPTGSHRHHYSLWIAHHDVGGKDFWSEQGGSIVHEDLALMEDGPVFCQVVQNTRWVFERLDLMHERRTLSAYNTPDGLRLLDIEMEFTPAGKAPLVLGKTTFGFLSARVAESMDVFDGGGEILTSRGDRNEAGAHLKHGDWIDQSGPIAPGKWGGISIFDHPSNPNHPTGFHCRNDGWACASFNIDQPYTLEAGKPLLLKYRVLLHRGNAQTGEVAQRYDEYAAQPEVTFGQAVESQGPSSGPVVGPAPPPAK